MMLICNHINLHIELINSLTKIMMVTEMSTELHDADFQSHHYNQVSTMQRFPLKYSRV